MKSPFCYSVVILIVFISINGQIPQPLGPGIFVYKYDTQDVNSVVRIIMPENSSDDVKIIVNLTLSTSICSNFTDLLSPYRIKYSSMNNGVKEDEIIYRLEFPLKSFLPKLTGLTVYGNTLCSDQSENSTHPRRFNWFYEVPSVPVPTSKPSTQPAPPHQCIFESVNTSMPDEAPTPSSSTQKVPGPHVANVQKVLDFGSTEYKCGKPKINIRPLKGGREYVQGTLPWLVALGQQNNQSLRFICAGSLVSDQHIVTAAHCIYMRDQTVDVQSLVVILGAINLDDFANDVMKRSFVKEATPHSSYDPIDLRNDIAVLTLVKRIAFTHYIIPICLWSEDLSDDKEIVGRRGLFAGWGMNKENVGRGRPLKALIPIVDIEKCQISHEDVSKVTSNTTICAGESTGPCSGDAGGGLYLKYRHGGDKAWRLRGVASLSLATEGNDGKKCECNKLDYSKFVNAANYTPWIRSIIIQRY